MTKQKKIPALIAGLIISLLLTGCNKSDKPFPDNDFKWSHRTEKPFPDNTGIWLPSNATDSGKATEPPQHKNAEIPANPASFTITQPVSYKGIVPCSDCEKIELVLTLRPDQVFFLRKDYQHLPKRKLDRQQEIGGWKLTEDGKSILLKRSNYSVQTLAIKNAKQLEILNAEGKKIAGNNSYLMTRITRALKPVESMNMQGMYYENNGRGYWLDCQSEVTWPVARAGDYVNLSQHYNALNKPTSASAVLTTFTGHLTVREDGISESDEILVIDKFEKLENRFSCQ